MQPTKELEFLWMLIESVEMTLPSKKESGINFQMVSESYKNWERDNQAFWVIWPSLHPILQIVFCNSRLIKTSTMSKSDTKHNRM